MYKPAVRFGSLIFTAGMTPRKDGVLLYAGQIGPETDLEACRGAVRQAAENALTAALNCLSEGETLQILSLTVYVNAAPGFTAHPKVGDMASEYLSEKLGSCGIGPRAAVGAASLPGNAPVEVQLVAGVR